MRAGGVVGTGSPGTCTGDALAVAMTSGGLVTFNCGGPATLSISSTQTIVADVTIDGANSGSTVTVTAPSGVQLFHVNAGKALTLSNLTVADLNYFNVGITSFGGRIVVSNGHFISNTSGAIQNNSGGSVLVIQSSFEGTAAGAAIYTSPGGSVTVSNSTFVSNTSGAIYGADATLVNVTATVFDTNHAGSGAGIVVTLGTRP